MTNSVKVILPLIPHICDMEQLKKGGEHWYWDPKMPIYFAVLPRRGGKPEDVKVQTAESRICLMGKEADEFNSTSMRRTISQAILQMPMKTWMAISWLT